MVERPAPNDIANFHGEALTVRDQHRSDVEVDYEVGGTATVEDDYRPTVGDAAHR